ncbi:MAG: 3-deoxy-D-manno-octulosonic acid transferase [Candidatus Omnitrophota bacterium]
MTLLYDLVFILFIIINIPVYLFKGKFHCGFIRRFGVLPKGVEFHSPIWVHAVSVGEAVSARRLIEGLRKIYPEKQFVISTVTPTGNTIARSIAKEKDFVTYLPFDISCITNFVIKRVKPCIFIIIETELWPNLINSLHKNAVPVVVLNARISDASFKGYLALRKIIKPILKKVSIFCAQSKSDSLKLSTLGVVPAKIEVTGNMKFDQDISSYDSAIYRAELKLDKGDILLVAGSTHPKEEEVLLDVYKKLLKPFPYLRLLLAPRHPERSDNISKLVRSKGFLVERVSVLKDKTLKERAVFILDTIGNLVKYYSAADIVFVGGSLVKRGGHNILEPAFLNKPVFFGPYIFNFRDIAQEFLNSQAALQVLNAEGLIKAIKGVLTDNSKADVLVNNAQLVIAANRGATDKNISLIKRLIL